MQVIPFLPRPLLLTDFLLTSYSVGGAISLLALSSVYTLISQHNLEFPQFYIKLYALFAPEVMHVKYRARFFHLSSLFLSSTHLPEYLVAAFVKRLARLCLTAPAHCIPMALRYVTVKLCFEFGTIFRQVHPQPYPPTSWLSQTSGQPRRARGLCGDGPL